MRTDAACNLFFGDECCAIECGNELFFIDGHKNSVVLQNDAVVINILSFNQTREEDHFSDVKNDILSGQINADGFLVVAEQFVKLVDCFGRNNKIKLESGPVLFFIFNLCHGGAFCKFETVASHRSDLSFLYLKVTAVEHRSLIVDRHGIHHFADHFFENGLGDHKPILGDKAGNNRVIIARNRVHSVA